MAVFRKALAVLTAGAFFLVLALQLTGNPARIRTLQGSTMGTSWQVQLATAADEEELAQLGSDIQTLLAHLDREVFSSWAPDSELSLLNRSAAGEARTLSPELLEVLLLSRRIYEESEHSFDISIAPLVDLWGFGPIAAAGRPADPQIAAARAKLGLPQLRIDAATATVWRPEGLTLDLAGIAKGYAVDKLAERLLAAGHADFIAEIGGEIRLQGRRPDQQPWIIAVEAPHSGAREVQARIATTDGAALAIAGSGDYRNFRELEGQRFSHEIDPRSGYPVDHALTAVTVVAESAAAADAWATALMVLGPEDGLRLAIARNLAAYFIMRAPAGLVSRPTPAFAAFLYAEQGIEHGQKQF